MYKAAVAAERAAYEQYQMAVDGAQKEDKASAASMVDAAKVQWMKFLLYCSMHG